MPESRPLLNGKAKAAFAAVFDLHGRVVVTTDDHGRMVRQVRVKLSDSAYLNVLRQCYGGEIEGDTWIVSKRQAERFVSEIEPYSVRKTLQLELFLRAARLVRRQENFVKNAHGEVRRKRLTPNERRKRFALAEELRRLQRQDAHVVIPKTWLVERGADY